MRHFLLSAILIFTFSCCPTPDEEAAAAIAKASREFSQAYVDGDLEKQMSYYTKDVVIIPGNRPMIEGIEEVTKYWTPNGNTQMLEHRTISNKLEIEGNLASDYGIYEGRFLSGADTASFRGQYVVTWRKEEDGQWRMAVDMWSALSN